MRFNSITTHEISSTLCTIKYSVTLHWKNMLTKQCNVLLFLVRYNKQTLHHYRSLLTKQNVISGSR